MSYAIVKSSYPTATPIAAPSADYLTVMSGGWITKSPCRVTLGLQLHGLVSRHSQAAVPNESIQVCHLTFNLFAMYTATSSHATPSRLIQPVGAPTRHFLAQRLNPNDTLQKEKKGLWAEKSVQVISKLKWGEIREKEKEQSIR